MLEQLWIITRGWNHRYPDGNNPYKIMTRLLEECGEVAQQVNHFEGAGIKRQKYGEPDRKELAKEVSQVLRCALEVAVYYNLEVQVEAELALGYQWLKAEGHIVDEEDHLE